METADPAVIAANNLKAQPDEVFRAIEIVNEVGGARQDGIPGLLPGLNFVCGLAGETPATYDKNEQFLARVLTAGLMVRRVNIRQVMPFEGTPAYTDNTLGKNERRFKAFKEFVRNKIDLPMLQRVFPIGTILRDVRIEVSGELSFGRQPGCTRSSRASRSTFPSAPSSMPWWWTGGCGRSLPSRSRSMSTPCRPQRSAGCPVSARNGWPL